MKKILFLFCFAMMAGCASSAKKPWDSPEKGASQALQRVLKSGKKVNLAVLGRATADLTRDELEYFDVKKEKWQKSRTAQENDRISGQLQTQFREEPRFELIASKELDEIVLGRKFDDPGRPLEQEAVEVAHFAHSTHLLYWTLTRIPYGKYKMLDKMTLKLIEIQTGSTLSLEVFQEIKN